LTGTKRWFPAAPENGEFHSPGFNPEVGCYPGTGINLLLMSLSLTRIVYLLNPGTKPF